MVFIRLSEAKGRKKRGNNRTKEKGISSNIASGRKQKINLNPSSYAYVAIQHLASTFLCRLLPCDQFISMHTHTHTHTRTCAFTTTELSHAEHVSASQARCALGHFQVFRNTSPCLRAWHFVWCVTHITTRGDSHLNLSRDYRAAEIQLALARGPRSSPFSLVWVISERPSQPQNP